MIEILNRLFRSFRHEEEIYSVKDNDDTISVIDYGEERALKLNNVVYSRLNKKSIYTGSYWDYFTPLPALFNNPRILMIGLGGGTVAFQLKKIFGKKVTIDIVEISRKMVEAAKYFLPVKLDKVSIIVDDGVKYIKTRHDFYDIIILDAYEGDHIPQPFFEDEFISAAHSALKSEGVLAINYALNLSALVYLEHYLKSLRRYFKTYTINNPFTSGNMIILCSKSMEKKDILEKIKKKVKQTKDNKPVLVGYNDMS
jgi:spermidine synthase